MATFPYMTRLNYSIALASISLLTLTACAKTLDSEKISQSIQQDVIKQGGISLKSVTCPPKIEPKANEPFECTGEMENGYTFTIAVKQKDDQGTVTWDVPNTKGMLNLAKFETSLQEAVQSEIGARPIVRCGGDGFKPVKPGQIFECKVDVKEKPGAAKTAKPTTPPATVARDAKAQPGKSNRPKQPDKIVVAIDADGNVNWQRVVPGGVSQLLPKPAQAKPAPSQAAATTPQATAASPRPNAPAPPAQKNAEDFLNQTGASDQFED